MRSIAVAAVLGLLAFAGTTGGAEAKGCLKGAAVGGVAGHVAGHHTVLGAAAGCAIGHHEAAKADRERAQQVQRNDDAPNGSTTAR